MAKYTKEELEIIAYGKPEDREDCLADIFDKEMKRRNIKHDIRITNASFKGWANRKGVSFPDRFFSYNNKVFMVELKIKKRNPERIEKQVKIMNYWRDNGGVYCSLIKTKRDCEIFWIVADDGKVVK